MAKRVQRYGVTATVMETLVGYARELVVNLTRQSVHLHDGATPGGFELGRADCSNMTVVSSENNGIMTPALYAALVAAGEAGSAFAELFPNVDDTVNTSDEELNRLYETLTGGLYGAAPAPGKVVLYTGTDSENEETHLDLLGDPIARIPSSACDFPEETVMLFYMETPPIFWRRDGFSVPDDENDFIICAASAAGSTTPGTTEGTHDPANVFMVYAGLEGTAASNGAHTHSVSGSGSIGGSGGNVDVDVGNGYLNSVSFTGTAASDGAHTHDVTLDSFDLDVQRAYCCFAEKVYNANSRT